MTKVRKNIKITKEILKKTFQVHDGKSWVSVFIRPIILDHKVGEFIFTKKKLNGKK